MASTKPVPQGGKGSEICCLVAYNGFVYNMLIWSRLSGHEEEFETKNGAPGCRALPLEFLVGPHSLGRPSNCDRPEYLRIGMNKEREVSSLPFCELLWLFVANLLFRKATERSEGYPWKGMSARYCPVVLISYRLAPTLFDAGDRAFPSMQICLSQRFSNCNPFFIFFGKIQ